MINPITKEPTCVHCNVPMKRVRVEDWYPSNLLLKQLQKIVDGATTADEVVETLWAHFDEMKNKHKA